ncbi:MAG: 4-diphosphocytidyl-2C-methyl-D-erythritol kinase [Fibrobacteres bacterium]|nr:4-diphosphocytidyl-2C-methyl-D-erythritol kinase [Fibrobacterota bacterium]
MSTDQQQLFIKGSIASGQGKVLEENIITTFIRKGFTPVMWSEWNKDNSKYGEELLLKNVPFKNLYGHDGYTEFLLLSKRYNTEIRIECKWQQSSGSVDEKFPYLYLNCIEAMPEKHVVIVIDGGGARDGAIKWLKNAAEKGLYRREENKDKKIDVVTLSEFIQWTNLRFR